jgi:hypothetical protein
VGVGLGQVAERDGLQKGQSVMGRSARWPRSAA